MSVDHLPSENFHETNAKNARDEDGSIHNLQFGLVGLEELDGTINGPSKEDDSPYPDKNCSGPHFSAVEVPCH